MFTPLLALGFWQSFFGVLMFATALFLILLVLVQRGRGGGLAGAFGGMGGQSAFGAKAGDVFTKITIISAGIWILLCIAAIAVLNNPGSKFGTPPGTETSGASTGAKETPDGAAPPADAEGGAAGTLDASPAETPAEGTAAPAEQSGNQ